MRQSKHFLRLAFVEARQGFGRDDRNAFSRRASQVLEIRRLARGERVP